MQGQYIHIILVPTQGHYVHVLPGADVVLVFTRTFATAGNKFCPFHVTTDERRRCC